MCDEVQKLKSRFGRSRTRNSFLSPKLVVSTRDALNRLYSEYEARLDIADPIQVVRRYNNPRDQEIVAFCAAGLAFGRVSSVLNAIESLLLEIGPSPKEFVRKLEPSRHGRVIRELGHRWIQGHDLVALLWLLRKMLETTGSIQEFFRLGYSAEAEDIGTALDQFSTRVRSFDLNAVYPDATIRRGVNYFFPRPSDGVDFGVWNQIKRSQLVVPLDTDVIRVGQCLKLTTYRSPGWNMAKQITHGLRQFDQSDPVKYDFALCHLGMLSMCGFKEPFGDQNCPLRGVCRPSVGRRRRSHQPSVRR